MSIAAAGPTGATYLTYYPLHTRPDILATVHMDDGGPTHDPRHDPNAQRPSETNIKPEFNNSYKQTVLLPAGQLLCGIDDQGS